MIDFHHDQLTRLPTLGKPSFAELVCCAIMLNFTLDGRVAVIELDDGKANAMSHAFCAEVSEAFERAAKEAGAV
ncbi:MAG: hypothetical protein AAFN74_21580, partial [Myxococcota bacterium]